MLKYVFINNFPSSKVLNSDLSGEKRKKERQGFYVVTGSYTRSIHHICVKFTSSDEAETPSDETVFEFKLSH